MNKNGTAHAERSKSASSIPVGSGWRTLRTYLQSGAVAHAAGISVTRTGMWLVYCAQLLHPNGYSDRECVHLKSASLVKISYREHVGVCSLGLCM